YSFQRQSQLLVSAVILKTSGSLFETRYGKFVVSRDAGSGFKTGFGLSKSRLKALIGCGAPTHIQQGSITVARGADKRFCTRTRILVRTTTSEVEPCTVTYTTVSLGWKPPWRGAQVPNSLAGGRSAGLSFPDIAHPRLPSHSVLTASGPVLCPVSRFQSQPEKLVAHATRAAVTTADVKPISQRLNWGGSAFPDLGGTDDPDRGSSAGPWPRRRSVRARGRRLPLSPPIALINLSNPRTARQRG